MPGTVSDFSLRCQHPTNSLVTPTLLVREVTARSGLSPMDGGPRSLLGRDAPFRLPPRPARRLLPAHSRPSQGDVPALSPSRHAILFRLPSAPTASTCIPSTHLHGHRPLSTDPPDPPSPLQKTVTPTANNQTEVPAMSGTPGPPARAPPARDTFPIRHTAQGARQTPPPTGPGCCRRSGSWFVPG